MPIPEEENPDYGSERIYFHDKNLPPKSLRIQIGSSQEQKTDSDNRNHVLDEDDRPVLMRGDSVTRSRASSIQSQPDFSGFGTSDDGRPSPAQDEMMFKMDDELIPARQRTRQPFDNQRTERSRADAKRVTPWDFRSRCNSSEDYAVERITTDLRANETSASKLTEPVEPPPKLLGSETLSVIKTRMKRTFDSALRLSEDDALPPPIGPKQEVVTKEVLPECEVCRNLGANYAKRSSISGFSPWSEAKQGRSFLEWQAGVPFKHTIPKELAFEASLSSNALKLPCGHAAPGTVTASPMSSSAPTRGTTFKPPMGIEARTGEQKVSRRAVAARRKRTVSSISGGGTSSIFTIQEAAPKAAPTPRKPTLLSASNDGKVTDKELLKGLGIVLEAVNNEDVDAWINEVTGSGVRKFLADLSKMDKLGTGGLAQRPRRQATVRKQALEGTERLKEREGLERIQSMSEEGEM